MKWTQLTIKTESEAVEAVSNILMEAGAAGVAIEDAKDLENYQPDLLGEIINKDSLDFIQEGALVMAYFPETTYLPELLPGIETKVYELPKFGLEIGEAVITTNVLEEQSWETAWKKYYHPIAISRFLTIVPKWESYQPTRSDERVIYLDPGMAFGTGTHPTTYLSLHGLEMVLRGGETVVDVGTGSGVLSIASKHFGAKEVYAYDLDQVAVQAAEENMALNPVAKDVKVAANDLLTGVNLKADVVVANILADIILKLIPDAWRILKETGVLIVSGIIEDKKEEVVAAALEQGFVLQELLQKSDWYGLIFEKPALEE